MSNTKGSMLISNANAVGAELVNKLGGTGYKPVEWADAINLLGVSNDDKASALAGITEGTYTGDERGSIKYSNCNAVGAMLNKKFSTNRGFKPVEWESAISKLTPLAEGTVSGAICNIVNGADDVPTKSLVVTIPPTLSGVSSVTETQTGRNLLLLTDGTYTIGNTGANATILNGEISVTGTTVNSGGRTTRLSDYFVLHAGTYYISPVISTSPYVRSYLNKKSDNTVVGYSNGYAFTISEDTEVYYGINIESGKTYNTTLTPQVEIGSTAHDYEPYTAPTQYTASLGRTIYGGEVDIVKGVGSEQGYKVVVDGTNLYFAKAGNYYNSYPRTLPTLGNPWKLAQSDEISFGYNSNYGGFIFLTVARAEEFGLYSAEEVNAYFAQNPTTIILNLATPTDFTFDGQEIDTMLGYNAFWSDSGDTEVTYRKDPDIPDQPVQLLDMNNNENNDN